ncbi:MAG: LTA synthase family protein [Muribaculaceae bacterium]|nr:LTA synthase family protein [Muribaculaceae bacterium]
MKTSERTSARVRAIAFYAILVGCLCSLWVLFLWRTDSLSSRLTGDYARITGDVVLLTCPYWFSGRVWRRVGLFLAPAACAVLLVNLWYFNAWGDIIPPWAVTYTGNVDGNLLRATGALINPGDIFFVLISLIPVAAWFILDRPDWRPSVRNRWLLVLCSLGVYGLSVGVRIRSIIVFNRIEYALNFSVKDAVDELLEHPKIVQLASLQRGPVLHAVNIARDFMAMGYEENPSSEELKRIESFLHDIPGYEADSAFLANRGKNIVLIIVESLNGELIDKCVGGREVTPVLNRLTREEGCVFSTEVVSQVKYGRSIDGQLLTNTGLLPLDKGVSSVSARASLPFLPSLPRIFKGYDSYAVMGTKGVVWGERDAALLTGYEQTSTLYDFAEKSETHDVDGAMFRHAIGILGERVSKGSSRPFIMELISGSMHLPYEDTAAPHIPEFSSVGGLEGDYYTVTSYFDACLGRFINKLKEMGLYDNTVVFVMSDHENTFEPRTRDEDPQRTFFGAFNCGRSERIERTTGQVNIYPAILEIMGMECNPYYHGLGASMLSGNVDSAYTPYGKEYGPVSEREKEAYTVADEIWRYNFFEKTDE